MLSGFFIYLYKQMNLFNDTFERHKKLLFESLQDNWEDRVDWTQIIALHRDDKVSSTALNTTINDNSTPVTPNLKVDSRPTEEFWAMFQALPPKIQLIAKESYKLFNIDPYNMRLRFHRLKQGHDTYAVNVGGSYRAIGIKQSGRPDVLNIKWIWIGYHGSYDDELSRIKKKSV